MRKSSAVAMAMAIAMAVGEALKHIAAKLHSLLRAFLLWILSAGPIPLHIAIIMDGNRRFADRIHVNRWMGHIHGYQALMLTLKDCFDLHVKIVSLYAFSIDNFRRPPEEVSALMDLMQNKLESLIEKEGLARSYGVRVRVLGDLSLLPEGVRRAAEEVMELTKHNENAMLNLFVSYSSSHEIVQAAQTIRDRFVSSFGHGSGLVECEMEATHAAKRTRAFLECDAGLKKVMHATEKARCIDELQDDSFRSTFKHGMDHLCEACTKKRVREGFRPCDVDAMFGSEERTICTMARIRGDRGASGGHDEVDWDECLQRPIQTTSKKGIGDDLRPLSGHGLDRDEPPGDEGTDLHRALEKYVSEDEIERHLYTGLCGPPPDLLIRTSGETRLSNFMLWQTTSSRLTFCKVLWPEFSLKDLFFIILDYQRSYPALMRKRQSLAKAAALNQ